MKRVLSLVLALVLVLGSMPLAFADEHMTAGDQLYEWNLIAGRSATEKDLDEEGTLTRAELMVLFAQLNGVAEEAESFELPSGFSDVAEDAWYAPWIAYGKMAGWTAGYPDGTFKPANAVSAQEMASFALNVLGYEVNWATALEDAAAMGIDVEAMNTAMMTRGEGFAVMLAVVNTVPNGETEKLGVKLGVLEPEAPVVVVPEELEVVSVEALNLVQIEVVFNQEVDKDTAEDTDNYSVEDEDFDLQDASLQEDGMTVILTLDLEDTIPEQEEEATVVIEGVEDLDENVMADVEFDIEFLDTTFPEAVMAEVVGNDTIKIYFSEPIMGTDADDPKVIDEDYFDVDGEYVKDVKLANNNTEANIEIYSTLEEGVVEVTVDNDVEDFAGNGMLTTTFEVEVVEDEEAPTIVGYKDADEKEVTLIFNEDIEFANFDNYTADPIENDSDDPSEDFYHTNTKNIFETAIIDGNELTLTFGEDEEMPEGTVYIFVAEEAINDLWDNENGSDLKVAIEIEIDNTAPVVEKVESGDSEEFVEVTFNEDIANNRDNRDEDNFTLLDADGDEADEDIKDVTISGDKITIEFDDDLSGDYTLVIENVEDLSGNVMEDTSVDFFADDVSAPTVDDKATIYNSGDEKNQMIKVTFSEAMTTDGRYSVEELENYVFVLGEDEEEFDLVDLDDDYGVTISVVDDGEAVEIEIPGAAEGEDSEDGIYIGAGDKVLVSRVADEAGNYTTSLQTTVTIEEDTAFGFVDGEAIAVAADQIEVELEKAIEDLDDEDFVVQVGDMYYFNDSEVSVNGGTTLDKSDEDVWAGEIGLDLEENGELLVIEILDGTLPYDAEGVVVWTVDAPNSTDQYGTKIAGEEQEAVEDDIAPTVVKVDGDWVISVDYDGDTTTKAVISVTFEEAMDTTSINRFDVEVTGGFDVTAISFTSTDSVINITVMEEDDEEFDLEDLYLEEVSFDADFRDAAGNKIDVDDNEDGYEIPEVE